MNKDFKKRVEIIVLIKCVDNEQDIVCLKHKEVLHKDFRTNDHMNDDYIEARLSATLIALKEQLPSDFADEIFIKESSKKFWEEHNINRIVELQRYIKKLETAVHSLKNSHLDLEVKARKNREDVLENLNKIL